MGSRDETQVRLGGKGLYLLSHCASPKVLTCKCWKLIPPCQQQSRSQIEHASCRWSVLSVISGKYCHSHHTTLDRDPGVQAYLLAYRAMEMALSSQTLPLLKVPQNPFLCPTEHPEVMLGLWKCGLQGSHYPGGGGTEFLRFSPHD